MIKINLVELVKNKIYFVLKTDLVKFALEKDYISKKNLSKDVVIDAILKNINEDLALELTKVFSNKIGFTGNEIEQLLNISKSERQKWTKNKSLNVTGYYDVRAYGRSLDCPIYDAVQVLNLTDNDIENWRNKRKPSAKQLKALERGRKKMLENRTCKRCGDIQAHKNNLNDEGICFHCIDNEITQERERIFQQGLKDQREKAIAFFKSWTKNQDHYLILDVETTGLGYDDEIIEIAIIDLHGNVLIDTLVKSTVPISPGAYEVHGISQDMLKDKPTWNHIYPKVKDIISDKTLLIFNADFDIRMLYQSCRAYNIDFEKPKNECIMVNFARIYGEYSSYYNDFKWISLAEATGNYQTHRSKDDCFLCLDLIDKVSNSNDMKEGYNIG